MKLRIGTRRALIEVESLADASRTFLRLQRKALDHGSILRSATIYDATMTEVARISQNGRVWPPVAWVPGLAPLYEPDAADVAVLS